MIPSERITKRGTQNRVFLTLLALAVLASVVKDLNRLHSWTVALFPDRAPVAHIIESSDTEHSCSRVLAEPQHTDRLDWVQDLDQSQVTEVKALNDDIAVEPTVGGAVEVTATRKSTRTDRASNSVRALEHVRGVTTSAADPTQEHGVQTSCKTSSGSKRKNPSAALYVRGNDLHIEWPGTVEFKTFNNGISVDLPATLSTRLESSGFHGALPPDFPLTMLVNSGRKRVSGTTSSGRDLVLKTPNGSIRVKRSS